MTSFDIPCFYSFWNGCNYSNEWTFVGSPGFHASFMLVVLWIWLVVSYFSFYFRMLFSRAANGRWSTYQSHNFCETNLQSCAISSYWQIPTLSMLKHFARRNKLQSCLLWRLLPMEKTPIYSEVGQLLEISYWGPLAKNILILLWQRPFKVKAKIIIIGQTKDAKNITCIVPFDSRGLFQIGKPLNTQARNH